MKTDLCCQVNQVYCIFLGSLFQHHLNGRLKQYLNWIFKTRSERHFDDVAQLENTINVLSLRVTDFFNDCYFDQEKSLSH